jgi:hypothetical protein
MEAKIDNEKGLSTLGYIDSNPIKVKSSVSQEVIEAVPPQPSCGVELNPKD